MLIVIIILIVIVFTLLFIIRKLLNRIEQLKLDCALFTQIIKFGEIKNERIDKL